MEITEQIKDVFGSYATDIVAKGNRVIFTFNSRSLITNDLKWLVDTFQSVTVAIDDDTFYITCLLED